MSSWTVKFIVKLENILQPSLRICLTVGNHLRDQCKQCLPIGRARYSTLLWSILLNTQKYHSIPKFNALWVHPVNVSVPISISTLVVPRSTSTGGLLSRGTQEKYYVIPRDGAHCLHVYCHLLLKCILKKWSLRSWYRGQSIGTELFSLTPSHKDCLSRSQIPGSALAQEKYNINRALCIFVRMQSFPRP